MVKAHSELMLDPTLVCRDDGFSTSPDPALSRSAFPLETYRTRLRSERGPCHVDCPVILLALSGCEGRRWYRQNGKTNEIEAGGTGSIDIHGKDFQREWARWDVAPGRVLGVQLTSQVVQRLLPEVPAFDVTTQFNFVDPKLQWLLLELHDEIRRGSPGGPLYAESLSCALVALLVKRYGSQEADGRAVGGFTASRRRRVIDFIDANLGKELSIALLAKEVDLSPRRFASCFASSFGQPPHSYIQQRRVQTAMRLLTLSSRSIVEIAYEVGFSSQSHFAQVFRRHTGMTPSNARLS